MQTFSAFDRQDESQHYHFAANSEAEYNDWTTRIVDARWVSFEMLQIDDTKPKLFAFAMIKVPTVSPGDSGYGHYTDRSFENNFSFNILFVLLSYEKLKEKLQKLCEQITEITGKVVCYKIFSLLVQMGLI